ncbi:hypothetical protein C1A50_3831 [Paenibacillus polymyxa]|nr:hypothetical protein C1A50_3831 [Paenibacillus polymyxa]
MLHVALPLRFLPLFPACQTENPLVFLALNSRLITAANYLENLSVLLYAVAFMRIRIHAETLMKEHLNC